MSWEEWQEALAELGEDAARDLSAEYGVSSQEAIRLLKNAGAINCPEAQPLTNGNK